MFFLIIKNKSFSGNLKCLIFSFLRWFLSFFKNGWSFEDYPIRVRYQGDHQKLGRLELIPYHAQMINWWALGGSGNSPGEAVENLKKNFNEFKKNHAPYRPGAHAPLTFASTEEIDQYSILVDDLTQKIFGITAAFVSGESSLWDFCVDDDLNGLVSKIQDIYGVDVTDIKDGNLLRICRKISVSQKKKNDPS